jgi:hypothetical protein
MTVLQALAVLETEVLELKKKRLNTPEFREALDFVEPYVPQHALESENDGGDREGQQQVLRATFAGIRDSVRILLKKKNGCLASRILKTHDPKLSEEPTPKRGSTSSSTSRGILQLRTGK